MKLAAGLFLLMAAPAWAQCESSRQKQADLKKESDAWWSRHHRECTLCADGSACREGFEHRDAPRRQFDVWRAAHGQTCAACGPATCPLSDAAWAQAHAEAKAKHRERCRACEFDPLRCELWRRALDETKVRHEAWKREHPATCDRCSPTCPDWRARATELSQRHDEAQQKHKERCAECRSGKGGCDRPAAIRQDSQKERLALWKAHEACACRARR
jgi:hypothetical protein